MSEISPMFVHMQVFVVPQAYAGAVTGYCPKADFTPPISAASLDAIDDCILNQTIGYRTLTLVCATKSSLPSVYSNIVLWSAVL